jgi:hypothetical protein
VVNKTLEFVQQERNFQRLMVGLFAGTGLLVSMAAYTTRSFLYGDTRLPSAFTAEAMPLAGGGIGGAIDGTGVFFGLNNGSRALPAPLESATSGQIADRFGSGNFADNAPLSGSALPQTLQSGAGSGPPGVGTVGGDTVGDNNASPMIGSILPGGSGASGGASALGNVPPLIVPVPEPQFWVIAIIGFAGIGIQLRRLKARGRVLIQAQDGHHAMS